jgi:beta-glucuronidase
MRRSLLLLNIFGILSSGQCLFPKESETRDVKLLDGVWDFAMDNQDKGFRDFWYLRRLTKFVDKKSVFKMPVPSSYNDITQSKEVRDYVGWVWYQRTFFAPTQWNREKVVYLRFDSVHYEARVYLNGIAVVNHTGGHLPFQVDVTAHLNYGRENYLTVAVDNTLSSSTVPQGEVKHYNDLNRYPSGYKRLYPAFDFFNYAGIHRSVRLYAVPKTHIHDIFTRTSITRSGKGVIEYTFVYDDNSLTQNFISRTEFFCLVELLNNEDKVVARATGCKGSLVVEEPNLWWPIHMSITPGYLYTGKFMLSNGSDTVDTYYQRIGIRTVEATNTSFLINGKSFYFKGFGKHEDSAVKGRGLDIPYIIKDFNLMKWIGANSFRTSHYPYSEELMDQADEQGIVVIDECPAVGLNTFGDELYEQHSRSIQELIQRDKNRPSVVMWSIANEPQSQDDRANDYFKKLVLLTRSLDDTRPVSAALNQDVKKDHLAQYLDVLMINRYYGWYQDTGASDLIKKQLTFDLRNWFKEHNKPVMMSEYGADSVSGVHSDPSYVFTEDYQTELMMQNFAAFDEAIKEGFFVGEMIWNFQDFMTDQTVGRVFGNKKGIFTRDRQPKAAARILKCRYTHLTNESVTQDAEQGFMFCPRSH